MSLETDWEWFMACLVTCWNDWNGVWMRFAAKIAICKIMQIVGLALSVADEPFLFHIFLPFCTYLDC